MVVQMQLLKARDSKEAIAALQHLEFDCVSIDEDLSDNEKLLITELITENIYKQDIYVPTVVFTKELHAQNELTLVKAENLAQTLQQAIYIHKALKFVAVVNKFGESEECSSLICNCKLTPAEVNNLYKLLELNRILGYLAISCSKQRSLKPEKSPKPSGFHFAADSTSFNLTPFVFKSAIAPPRAINLRFDAYMRYSTTKENLNLVENFACRAEIKVDQARQCREVSDCKASELVENRRQAIMILSKQKYNSQGQEAISTQRREGEESSEEGYHRGSFSVVDPQVGENNESQHMGILQRLTNLINQQVMDLPNLLEVMVQEVYDTIDSADFCLMALYNFQHKQLELTTVAGIGTEKLPLLKLTDTKLGLLNQVFVKGASQLFQKNTEQENPHDFTLTPLPASIYAVAISAQGEKLGVLAIGNWKNSDTFNVASQNLLDGVGEVAAIALNNAKIMKALEEREERLSIQNEILVSQNRELEKIKQQNHLQNLQLLEAAQLKSQFLATTSHELRTPLNVILGLSQVLLRQRSSSLSEQQADMMQRILNNGNQLLTIVEDMLYFAKVEAGRLPFRLEEFDLSALVLKTVAENCCRAEEKGLNLQVQVNLDCPLVVNDSIRLKQVLLKLLLNAIKFTKTGSVEIKAWEIADDRIAIAVKDTGIGIAETDLEQIFEQFRQVDQSIARKYGGTGLGLAITKSLVEVMQGSISVNSEIGQGSTFHVELPRIVKCEACTWEIEQPTPSSNRVIF
ncbi:MAG: GAF domain-containing sensor histidine kinase [Heteroscytonema crispum UTEX LB 1556]